MRKFGWMAMAALLLLAGVSLLAGCSGDKAQAATCEGCQASVAQKDATMVGGKMLCPACAAQAATAEAGEMLVCANCGMKMAAADMKQVDGKWLCSHCVPADAGDDQAHDHDHGGGGH